MSAILFIIFIYNKKIKCKWIRFIESRLPFIENIYLMFYFFSIEIAGWIIPNELLMRSARCYATDLSTIIEMKKRKIEKYSDCYEIQKPGDKLENLFVRFVLIVLTVFMDILIICRKSIGHNNILFIHSHKKWLELKLKSCGDTDKVQQVSAMSIISIRQSCPIGEHRMSNEWVTHYVELSFKLGMYTYYMWIVDYVRQKPTCH